MWTDGWGEYAVSYGRPQLMRCRTTYTWVQLVYFYLARKYSSDSRLISLTFIMQMSNWNMFIFNSFMTKTRGFGCRTLIIASYIYSVRKWCSQTAMGWQKDHYFRRLPARGTSNARTGQRLTCSQKVGNMSRCVVNNETGKKGDEMAEASCEVLRGSVKCTICTASLTFNNSTFCPHSVFVSFVWIWEQTAIISLYNINWLVFTTEI